MQLDLGGVSVDVVQKNIKNVHLSVYPPTGRVRIAAPLHASLDTIRIFAISKLSWIKQQQGKVSRQQREQPREFLERESHYLWGKRYLLRVVEAQQVPALEVAHNKLILRVRPHTAESRRAEILDAWYREQLKAALPPLVDTWRKVTGVAPDRFFVQRMKTRWGSCNAESRSVRLNTDLAKKPPQCLEYILVHEMTHLLEPTHNARFASLMDRYLPAWRHLRDELNCLPVRHEDWKY